MKKACLFLFCVISVGFAQTQNSKPTIAVYATGYDNLNVLRVLSLEVNNGIIANGEYSTIVRAPGFFNRLYQEKLSTTEILEICKEHEAEFICAINIGEALGEHHITARIYNIKSVSLARSGSAASPLKTMDDVMNAASEIVSSLYRTPSQANTTAKSTASPHTRNNTAMKDNRAAPPSGYSQQPAATNSRGNTAQKQAAPDDTVNTRTFLSLGWANPVAPKAFKDWWKTGFAFGLGELIWKNDAEWMELGVYADLCYYGPRSRYPESADEGIWSMRGDVFARFNHPDYKIPYLSAGAGITTMWTESREYDSKLGLQISLGSGANIPLGNTGYNLAMEIQYCFFLNADVSFWPIRFDIVFPISLFL